MWAPVFLPQGATVKKLKFDGNRADVGATLILRLKRATLGGSADVMADLVADWSDGKGSIETTTINYPTIDNEAYSYALELLIAPITYMIDAMFYRAEITWN